MVTRNNICVCAFAILVTKLIWLSGNLLSAQYNYNICFFAFIFSTNSSICRAGVGIFWLRIFGPHFNHAFFFSEKIARKKHLQSIKRRTICAIFIVKSFGIQLGHHINYIVLYFILPHNSLLPLPLSLSLLLSPHYLIPSVQFHLSASFRLNFAESIHSLYLVLLQFRFGDISYLLNLKLLLRFNKQFGVVVDSIWLVNCSGNMISPSLLFDLWCANWTKYHEKRFKYRMRASERARDVSLR